MTQARLESALKQGCWVRYSTQDTGWIAYQKLCEERNVPYVLVTVENGRIQHIQAYWTWTGELIPSNVIAHLACISLNENLTYRSIWLHAERLQDWSVEDAIQFSDKLRKLLALW